jgi:hypothetical protein
MKVLRPNQVSDHPGAWSTQRTARLVDLSNRVTCKIARNHLERNAIFKLRYRSYFRAGMISENFFERHIEAVDHMRNTYLIGLYADCKLVSSLRVQIGSATTPNFSSCEVFPHVLEPLLRGNKTIVDMSCVATDGELARSQSYDLLPYVVLRSWIIAAEHFNADYIAAAVQPQHQIFYARALGCDLHREVRPEAHGLTSLGLITLNFPHSAERLYENLPFLRSTPHERQQLFEGDGNLSRVTGQRPSIS